MSLKDNCLLACTACRIVAYRYCCCCLIKKKQIRESCTVLMIGLSGAGKTTILAKLCQENLDNLGSTNGFLFKDVLLSKSVMHIKEVGGSEKLRKYWHHYYNGVNGVIFVIDGKANNDDINIACKQLILTLESQSLKQLPLLVLINKIDGSNQQRFNDISELINIPSLCGSASPRSFIIDYWDENNDVDRLKLCFENFSNLVIEQLTISLQTEKRGKPKV